MKKSKKISLVVSAICAAVGLIMCVAAVVSVKFDMNALAVWKTETKEYVVEETFTDIEINPAAHSLRILPSEDGICKAVCVEAEKLTVSVGVTEGVLEVNTSDEREWYRHVDIVYIPLSITLYLPEKEYGALNIAAKSGEVTISEELRFETLSVKTASGNIELNAGGGNIVAQTTSGNIAYGGVAEKTELKTGSGNITVTSDTNYDFSMTTDSGNIKVDRSGFNRLDITYGSGDADISSVTVSEGLTVSGKSGNLTFTDFDASYIDIITTSGNVDCALRTGKRFDVASERGDVEIPDSEDGGQCRIRTSTGDIKVSIKPNPPYQGE